MSASAPAVTGRLRRNSTGEVPHIAVQTLPGGGRRYQWQGGEVVLAAERVQACIEDGRLCISVGSPRFDTASPSDFDDRDAREWIALFDRHGDSAANRVRGRFGAIVIDPAKGELTLVTDRFATLPWCVSTQSDEIFFSDRADHAGPGRQEIDPQSLFNYFYFHTIPAPATVFRGVSRMPPASMLHWNGQDARVSTWWTPHFEEPRSAPLPALKGEFLDIVRESVRREACTGGPIATFLSGGTDSSTVSGMLCRISNAPAASYSIGFEADGYDEMAYARIAAKHFGTDHHEYYVTPDDLFEAIPAVAAHYDQPFGNSSAVPAWICARNARADGIAKMLAGDGGDELFGGNVRYAKQRIFGWYEAVPRALRATVLEPVFALPGMAKLPLLRKGASYVEQARVPLPDRMQMYNLLMRLGTQGIFSSSFLDQVDEELPLRMQRDTWQAASAHARINRMLAFDWKYTLADNDLPKVIGTTRLAGLEVGFPLLSDELLAFSLQLPPEWKLKGLTLRWFFKEALRGFLPDAIIKKKKHGFGLPFGVWAATHPALGRLARESAERFAERGVLRPDFVRDLMNRLLGEHPGYYGELVWIVMMAEQWMQAREAQTESGLRA